MKVHVVRWINLETGGSIIDSVWADPAAAHRREIALINEKHTYAWAAEFTVDPPNKITPEKENDHEQAG